MRHCMEIETVVPKWKQLKSGTKLANTVPIFSLECDNRLDCELHQSEG